MGWEAGLLGGFLGRKGEVEAENLRASELASQRESDVYKLLLGSENPELVAMATAGLLESAQPKKRKGGLKGWVGEMEGSQTFQRLMSFMNTQQPVMEERMTLPSRSLNDMRATGMPEDLPGQMVQPMATDVPAGAPAAGAPTSPVQPGMGGPPKPMAYSMAPPQPYMTQTGTALPQIFLTPEQRMRRDVRIKAEGEGLELEARGEAAARAVRNAGGTHEEAQDARMRVIFGSNGGTAGARYGGLVRGADLPIGTKDSFGRDTQPTAFYRRETLNGIEQFIPTIPPSSQIGTLRVLAAPNGRPAVYRIYPNNAMEFVREVPAGVDQIPVQHADGSTEIVPVPRQFQAPSATVGAPPPEPGAVAAPPATGPQQPTAPPQAQTAVPTAAPVKGPAGGISTAPPTAVQAATKRAATRLSTAENTQYGTPEGTTWGDIDRQGLVPMATDVRKAVDQIDVALVQMGKMEELVKKVFSGSAPAMARGVPLIGAAMERLAQEGSLTWAMNTEDYQNLVAARNLAIPGVARRTGEVGNLTPAEQEKAATALPNLGEGGMNTPDTLATALSKLEALKKQLADQRGLLTRGNAQRRGATAADGVPEELLSAPPGSVWEDEQGVPRWKKMPDGTILPY